MNNMLLIVAACWTVGTFVTWIRLGKVSSSSPGIRFLIAMIAWPFFIGSAGE